MNNQNKENIEINLDILKSIMDNIPASINIFDKNGKRIFVNPFYYHLSGKNKAMGFGPYLTSDGFKKSEYLHKKISEAIKKGKVSEIYNYPYKSHLKKTKNYFNFLIGPLKNKEGKIVGAYSVVNDATARYLIKRKLMQMNLILEKKVADRTAKLILANKRLKKLSKDKSLLVSDIAHEIKTVLTIIRGNLDIMDMGKKNKTPLEIECNNEIKKEVKKMSQIISDLVFITKSEVYANLLEKENFNLIKVARESVKSYEAIKRKKKIDVYIINSSKRPVMLYADKSKIIILMNNFLENALKFGKENGKLEIIFRQDKKSIYVTFRDNGCGIDKYKLRYITEPFFQVKKSRDAKIEKRGFGLGLAICQKIISAHGGNLRVESKGLNKGASFIVKLPIRKV